jgi:hypothetical protein
MGLDGTIKRANGQPLGTFPEVKRALSSAFPGLVLERSLSGLEKVQLSEAQGINYPKFLRENMAASPAKYEGIYEAADFSIQLYASDAEIVHQISIVLHGTVTNAEPLFALLEKQTGWIVSHP